MSLPTLNKQIKVGRNKGNARVWIENGTLAKYGFTRYTPLRVSYGDNSKTILITVSHDNSNGYTVAGRERGGKAISIIDLCSQQLTDFVDGATTATVEYQPNMLTIVIGATL